MYYIWSSLAFFSGLFIFWPIVIYKMFYSNKTVKTFMPPLFFILAICMFANAFLFKYNYGTISIYFKLEDSSRIKNYSAFFTLLPILFFIVIVFLFFIFKKFNITKIITSIMLVIILSETFLGLERIQKINKQAKETVIHQKQEIKYDTLPVEFQLSKTEKNVVIIFLDRAISAFFPYIVEQFPELNKSFDGFVYYPNCLSFGANTVNAAIPLIGGYDYIPQELSKNEKTLVEKQNDALIVLPNNFHEAGYNIKIADLPYANYKWDMDLDFYSQYDYIDAKNLGTTFGETYINEHNTDLSVTDESIIVNKNIKEFSILQILYPPIRKIFYGDDQYYTSHKYFDDPDFINAYSELYYLPAITAFNSEKSSFIFFVNNTCHSSLELLAPDYHPAQYKKGQKLLGTGTYKFVDKDQDYKSYQTNAAAIIQISRWLDYIKQNDAYDNTRIIIVSDHGFRHMNRKFIDFKDFKEVTNFNPLFLFKDFNSHGNPKTEDIFITNADVPYLATKNLDVSNINPFTKNDFRQASDFNSFEVVKISEDEVNPQCWLGKTDFKNESTKHYIVHDNIFDETNWMKLE